MKNKIIPFLIISLCTAFIFSCMDASDSAGNKAPSPIPGRNGIVKSSSSATTYEYTYQECVYIQSPGSTEAATIAANILIPKAVTEGETFPAIIFPNS